MRELAEAVSIPVVACGGAGKVADLCATPDAGAAAGSLFVFSGKRQGVLVSFPSPAEVAARGES